ncbi:MAG: BTAD domain-containing putative transcriptional regulator [Chloroflexota bacterium]
MPHLSLRLFNSFRATLDEQPVTTFESDKVRGLLIYLVVEAEQVHSREKLAGLFWPDFSEKSARTNLRRALANLRSALKDALTAPPFLLITRSELQFNRESHYTLDVMPFIGLEPESNVSLLEARVSAYQGPFLAGFSLADSEPFEEWLTLKREQFQRTMLESLQTLIAHYESEQTYPQAMNHAYRLIDMEPWLEEGHQALMRLLALTGQRSKALQQFDACQQALWDGLGVEVSEATQTLYEQIKTDAYSVEPVPERDVEIGVKTAIQPVKHRSPFPAHSLPAPTTSFIGRQRESHELINLLTDDHTRLITILGPGGIGKSHFAVEMGRKLLNQFANGVFFVPLASVQQTEQLISTIAEVIGYPLQSDGRAPEQQLQDFFHAKTVLLILDNMEQLVDGADLLSRFLQGAPNLKILVTSRERLRLRDETVFLLTGLALTEDGSAVHEDDDAVQLFYKTAQRIQPDFAITDEHTQLIGKICRLVEGMPLAILLAASWIDQLTLADIDAELLDDTSTPLDLLTTDFRDIPERHRHIQTVFDHSWRRLTENERSIFMALSVFRGGFTLEAAQAVTKTSLRILTNLANKTLANRTAAGRYSIHELLRQYGALALEASPNHIKICDAHAAYYATYLSDKGSDLKGPRQADALNEIEIEIGNIQQSWRWGIDQKQLAQMAQMIEGLGMFYEWKGRYAEGEMAFRTGVEQLSDSQSSEERSLCARLLTWQGVFVAALGQPDLAQRLLRRSNGLIEQTSSEQDMSAARAFNLWQQARLIREQSYENARGLFEEALELFQVLGDQWSQAYLLYELAITISTLEPHQKTLFQNLIQKSLSLHQTVENRFGTLETLNRLGLISALQGDFKQCDAWFNQATIIDEQIGNDINVRREWLSSRSDAYWFMGRYEEALSVNQEQLAIAENFGEQRSIMGINASLGMSLIFLGHYDEGVQVLETTRADCQRQGAQALLSYILLQLAGGYIGQGRYQNAYDTHCECIDLHRSSHSNIRLYTALNNFGVAAWHIGKITEAKSAQDEVLSFLAQDETYAIQIGLMPLVALLQLSQDNPMMAVEYYTLALMHPHIGNSQWYADIVGQYIDEAAQSLLPEVVLSAQERGRARELNATVQALVAALKIG